MHPLAFILAVAAAIVFGVAALGRDYPRPRLIPLGLAALTVAWIVQLAFHTDDALLFFD